MNDTTSTSAIAQLLAERAKIDGQIAAAQLPALRAVQAVMRRPSTSKIADDLEKLRADLPFGELAHEQVGNVITVLLAVTNLITKEVERVEAQIGLLEGAAA